MSINLGNNFFNQIKEKNYEKIFSNLRNIPIPNLSGSASGLQYTFSNITLTFINNDHRNLNITLSSGQGLMNLNLSKSYIDFVAFYSVVNGSVTTQGSIEARYDVPQILIGLGFQT